MRRFGIILPATLLGLLLTAGPTLACGGLIGPNGAVNLLRTTTLAGYHDGVEHYVTAFQFAGGGGAFGSITPLPAVPTSVEKGGDWTLQRLIRETDAAAALFARRRGARPAAAGAEELMKVRIDALDITVLRGGAADIGTWANDHGFRLPPDAPEVLDFYAQRSQIFLAAAFDADAAAARGQQVGDGTSVHITIPTDNPWVPLRILALGKTGGERVDADVYLLTDDAPALLPKPTGDERDAARPQRARHRQPARRPPLRPRHGVGPVERLADEGRDRLVGERPLLRPRDRRERRRGAVPGRCRPRHCRGAPRRSSRASTARRLLLARALLAHGRRRDLPDDPLPPDRRAPLSRATAVSLDRAVAALGLGLAAALGAAVVRRGGRPTPTTRSSSTSTIHYSHFEPAAITVPAGRPVTFVIHNTDPIDHEWIVGDAALHERHRTGTEPVHNARPTEVVDRRAQRAPDDGHVRRRRAR